MEEIKVNSNGKINLSLDILYKREDGYHEIESVMQEVDLADRLTFKRRKEGLTIKSNSSGIPLDENNLVYKVWQRMCRYTGRKEGLEVYIEKNIPVGAGLAGGSSNSAATFKAINKLWDLNLEEDKLCELGEELGADIPFCIKGGTCLAKGIGGDLEELEALKDVNILLCNPGFQVSTPDAYRLVDLDRPRQDLKELIKAIGAGDINGVASNIANKMERGVIKQYPIIGRIKRDALLEGALASLMTGSGPTVFAIFEDEETMYKVARKLGKKYPFVSPCKTV